MIRDLFRTACVIAAMTVAAGLIIEVRFQLAAIDVAHRHGMGQPAPQYAQAQQPNTIRRFGRASLEFADAALGILR